MIGGVEGAVPTFVALAHIRVVVGYVQFVVMSDAREYANVRREFHKAASRNTETSSMLLRVTDEADSDSFQASTIMPRLVRASFNMSIFGSCEYDLGLPYDKRGESVSHRTYKKPVDASTRNQVNEGETNLCAE